MSRKPLFIHIGYPKTATTWLQRCVFPHLAGVDYLHFQDPRYDWLGDLTRQHDLVFDAAALRQRFEASVASTEGEMLLISWEGLIADVFSGGENVAQRAQRLYELFPEATIIITVRNQLSMIEALYRQYIHEGGTLSISDFMALRDPSPLRIAREFFYYDRVVELYQQRFGKEQVRVLAYEQLLDDRRAFLDGLFEIVGVTEDVAAIEERCASRVNVGMSLPSIYLARWFNRLVYSHFNPSALLPRRLLSARHVRFGLQRIADPLLFNHLPGGSLLNAARSQELADGYRDSNNRLKALSGLPLDAWNYPL